MLKLRFVILTLSCAIILSSCLHDSKMRAELKKVVVQEVQIKRYDQALFSLHGDDWGAAVRSIQGDYAPFLEVDFGDTANLAQLHAFISDEFIQQVQSTTSAVFLNLKTTEKELTNLFRYIRYYFPSWNQPQVYTYISGLSDKQQVLYNETTLIVALDMYLGIAYEGYRQVGFPIYRIKRMEPAYLLPDIAKEIASAQFLPQALHKNLLDRMITEGKLLYLADCFLPRVADQYKIGFSADELKWCKSHEIDMWAYFLEHQLLYSTDIILVNKFITDGPFTAPFHRDSPARAAVWVGWQIVRNYMKNNPEKTIFDLIDNTDAAELLAQSKYRPRKI